VVRVRVLIHHTRGGALILAKGISFENSGCRARRVGLDYHGLLRFSELDIKINFERFRGAHTRGTFHDLSGFPFLEGNEKNHDQKQE
jgi:hypothetical protein